MCCGRKATTVFVNVKFIYGLAAKIDDKYLNFASMERSVEILQLLDCETKQSQRAPLRKLLITYINDLILHNFQQLAQLLYRVDIDEKKLKNVLEENSSTDAAVLITDLILQRQEEKRKMRDQFKQEKNIGEDDKW